MHVPARREPSDPPEFTRLRERLLADLDRWPELVADARRSSLPLTDVEETDTAYDVVVELPGADPADVQVEVTAHRLVVTAERPPTGRLTARRHASRTEGRLRLDLALPTDVDAGAVTAELAEGLLRVHAPKSHPQRRVGVTRRPAS